MKVVGEREILASLVVLKHYSIAEMIRKENEKKKTKVNNLKCPVGHLKAVCNALSKESNVPPIGGS